MDTKEAWELSVFGRCVARADEEKARKWEAVRARGALTAWQLADGFLVGDVDEHRPTENLALSNLFYASAGWRLVARAWAEEGREAWERGHVFVAVALADLALEAGRLAREADVMARRRAMMPKQMRLMAAV